MRRIVVAGGKSIGRRCFEYILLNRKELDIEITALLPRANEESLAKAARQHGIRIVDDLEQMLELPPFDIFLSIQYGEILKKRHIDKAEKLAVNLHMAPLPEYRGCNQFSFAIVNGDKEFGATIHRLEESVDGGSILFEKRFLIPEGAWVADLLKLTEEQSVSLFQESIGPLVRGDFQARPQAEMMNGRKSEFHLREEIERLRCIQLEWPAEKIVRHVRATSMPGFPPPYLMIDGMKVELLVKKQEL